MNFRGKIVTLRALELEDMEALRSYHNDSEVSGWLGGWSFPISRQQQISWLEKIQKEPNNHRLAIDYPGHGFIGITTITDINYNDRRGSHGIFIGAKGLHGKGIGTDVVMTTMKLAFEEMQLHRLDGDILTANKASHRLYCDKCGWQVEGIRRQHAFRQNAYHDRTLVGILASEYHHLCKRTGYWLEA